MLISEQYRELNAELHARNPRYGTSGEAWAPAIAQVAESYGARTILDYGSGKGTLAQALPAGMFDVREYDPAVAGKDGEPQPAQMVACTDVLERIEPEFLDHVLNHLCEMTENVAFLVVATALAQKTLADGRNAHLIVEPARWWLPKLIERWDIQSFRTRPEGLFMFVGAAA